jgi:hypothetical protein
MLRSSFCSSIRRSGVRRMLQLSVRTALMHIPRNTVTFAACRRRAARSRRKPAARSDTIAVGQPGGFAYGLASYRLKRNRQRRTSIVDDQSYAEDHACPREGGQAPPHHTSVGTSPPRRRFSNPIDGSSVKSRLKRWRRTQRCGAACARGGSRSWRAAHLQLDRDALHFRGLPRGLWERSS